MAAKWLVEKRFALLHQNWRYSYYEVDIIASKEKVLHFIEVKTRRNKNLVSPKKALITERS